MATYTYIFLVLLDYQHAWMEAEEWRIKTHVLKTGLSLSPKSFANAFDTAAFEWAPRSSRPWSSLFDTVDTKFRACLWHFKVPHPSFSLTWIFSLLLTPWLFFRLLRQFEIGTPLSRVMTAIYLVSPGTLSFIVMLFRPAKAMANFSIVLALYWAATFAKKVDPRRFLVFLTFVFFSLFWDETSLLLLPAIPILFPQLFDRRRFGRYLLLLPLFFLFSWVVFPLITASLGFGTPHFFTYDVLQRSSTVWTAQLFWDFFKNARILFVESLSLFDPRSVPQPWGKTILLLNYVFLAFFGVGVFRKGKKRWRLFAERPLFIRLSLFFGGLVLAHTFLLAIALNRVWGPYWYGAYWSIFFVLWLALLGKFLDDFWKACIPLFALWVSLLYVFPFTNLTFKNYNFYPPHPHDLRDMFEGKVNRFDSKEVYPDLYNRTVRYWRGEHEALPEELKYLRVELKK